MGRELTSGGVLARASIVSLALLAAACGASKPALLGVVDGKLAACPSSPHCVTSQAASGSHAIPPIRYSMSRDEARAKLVEVMSSMPGAVVLTQSRDYVRAEYTSKRFKYVDDVEAYLDDRAKLVHLRSSSRTGFWDLGVNRRRVEEIRKGFLAAKPEKPEKPQKKEPAAKRRAQTESRE